MSNQITCDNEKQITLKYQLQFRQKLHLIYKNMEKIDLQLSEKKKKGKTSQFFDSQVISKYYGPISEG